MHLYLLYTCISYILWLTCLLVCFKYVLNSRDQLSKTNQIPLTEIMHLFEYTLITNSF